MTTTRRRLASAAILTLALAGTGVAPTGAQAPVAPPTLTIGLPGGGKKPTVNPAPLQPGPTQIAATTERRGETGFVLVRLRPGVTAEQIRKLTERKRLGERQIDRLGKQLTVFVAQGGPSRGNVYRTTIDLQPGTHIVLDISNERRQPQVAFEVAGEPNGAQMPAQDTTVDMRDFRFTKSTKTLPADGTWRVRNQGKQLHFMLAFPTSSSRNASRLEAILRSRRRDAERRSERYIAGPPQQPVGLVSPGTDNRFKVDLRPGNYVLVCFWGSPASRNRQHNQLGMARKVRVAG